MVVVSLLAESPASTAQTEPLAERSVPEILRQLFLVLLSYQIGRVFIGTECRAHAPYHVVAFSHVCKCEENIEQIPPTAAALISLMFLLISAKSNRLPRDYDSSSVPVMNMEYNERRRWKIIYFQAGLLAEQAGNTEQRAGESHVGTVIPRIGKDGEVAVIWAASAFVLMPLSIMALYSTASKPMNF